MSKSKGNVVNPLEVVEQYGADAVRFALVYGTALGHDQSLSYPKLDAMRKFTNKLWNMARFIEMKRNDSQIEKLVHHDLNALANIVEHENDKTMLKKLEELTVKVTKQLDNYDFNHASQDLYEFAWHEFADIYIEDVKQRIDEKSMLALESFYVVLLKLLHPFMPFVTEEIYQKMPGHNESIMIEPWPTA
jgi:valyl-tRNA synthetase